MIRSNGLNSFYVLQLLKNAISGKVGLYSSIDIDIYVVPKNYKIKKLTKNAISIHSFIDDCGEISKEKWDKIIKSTRD